MPVTSYRKLAEFREGTILTEQPSQNTIKITSGSLNLTVLYSQRSRGWVIYREEAGKAARQMAGPMKTLGDAFKTAAAYF